VRNHAESLSIVTAAHYPADLRGRRAKPFLHPAADELALTQSAVSHQIRTLEDHLGASLFGRLHRGIELTRDGRVLLDGVRAGLDSVLLASERVRSQRRVGVLTVAAPAACWAGSLRSIPTSRCGSPRWMAANPIYDATVSMSPW
jgi:hypothetical protein